MNSASNGAIERRVGMFGTGGDTEDLWAGEVDSASDLSDLFVDDEPRHTNKRGSKAKKDRRKGGGKPASVGKAECKQLPPEPQEGNTEYKLKLCDKSPERFQQLVTQMRWRLDEGDGKAVYMVGVTDAGLMVGIPKREFRESTHTLQRMARVNHAEIKVEETWEGPNGVGGRVGVRHLPEDTSVRGERVVFVGDAQAGKSSLASVLSSTEIDDGRGRARLELFRHGHEIRSGRTSSISAATMSFDHDGGFISPKQSRKQFNSPYQCGAVARTVTLFDLPGDPKYYKTTLGGIMGRDPDLAVLVVSPATGVTPVARELIGVLTALKIPLVINLSKCDAYPRESVDATAAAVRKVCEAAGLGPAVELTDPAEVEPAVAALLSGRATPVLRTSSVTGHAIPTLRALIGAIGNGVDDGKGEGGVGESSSGEPTPTPIISAPTITATAATNGAPAEAGAAQRGEGAEGHPDEASSAEQPERMAGEVEEGFAEGFEMQVQEVFAVSEAGPVVGGVVRHGIASIGQRAHLGPAADGSFRNVTVVGIRRDGDPCRHARAREVVTLELASVTAADLRPGQVLMSGRRAEATTELTAAVRLVPLCEGVLEADAMQVVVVKGGMKRAAVLTADGPIVAGRDTSATLSFGLRPECVRVGDTFLFRGNRPGFTGHGVVTAVQGVAPAVGGTDSRARSL